MKTRRSQIRRCSLCRQEGHTKRTCLKKQSIQKENTTKPVSVRVGQPRGTSSYLVNLKPEQKKNHLHSIEVFREKMAPKVKRVELDIAALIRATYATEKHEARVAEAKEKLEMPPLPQPPAARKKQRPRFQLPQFLFHQVSIQSFAVRAIAVLLIVALPFPALSYYNRVQNMSNQVVAASTAGFLSLQSATVAALGANIDQAELDLSLALSSFAEAQELMDQEHRALQYVVGLLPIIGTQVESRQHILVAGHHLALGNTYLVKGIDAAKNTDGLRTTDRFTVLTRHIHSAIPQYEEALTALSRVDAGVLPKEYQQPFEEFKVLFATFINDLEDLAELGDALHDVFGGDGFKRYLIVFQNNRELRPTGGFLGSVAIVDVQKGRIPNIEVPGGGLYDWQGQLDTHVQPPLPLQLVNDEWEAHDANWWPDFPASAKKLQWFYEHSRGATVDGVIAVNADVFADVLRVIGPITNDAFELQFEADTALDTLQEQVEVDYDKEENQPKAIIGALTEQLLTQPYESIDIVRLLTVWHTALEKKDIQVQMNDTELQELLHDFGWTGEIARAEERQDYLLVVNTNLQGQKSDAKMKQVIDHEVTVSEDGTAIGTVVINRTHTGTPGEQFYGSANINYLRIYVPEGAELLGAGGFQFPPEDAFQVPPTWTEVDTDLTTYEAVQGIHRGSGTEISSSFGKTVFGNWMITGPGETTQAYVVYRLPFRVFDEQKHQNTFSDRLANKIGTRASHYSLLVQKQSGINSDFHSKVIYPDAWKPVWRSHEEIDLAKNGAVYETLLDTDQVIGVAFEEKK